MPLSTVPFCFTRALRDEGIAHPPPESLTPALPALPYPTAVPGSITSHSADGFPGKEATPEPGYLTNTTLSKGVDR